MTAQSLCLLPAFQNGRPRFGHGFIQRRAVKAFKFSDDMLNKTWVYNQRRKIMSETFSSDRLFRVSNKLKVNDFKTAKTEASRSDTRMQKGKRVEDTPCQEIGITNRQNSGDY